MRLATIISLVVSAVLGIGALLVAKFWLPSTDKSAQAVAMAPVVVASKPIAFGTKLDDKNLAVIQLPVEGAPVGAYHSIKEVVKMDGGSPVALMPMAVREPLLPSKLSGAGARSSLSAMITPGMRAYTIKVDDVVGGGGHVLPGDRVDVLLARQMPSDGPPAVEANVVLQNVRVLGINLNADESAADKIAPRTATLEVTVDDAGRLSVASQVGTLSLALRRTGAAEIEPVRAVEVSDLRPYGAPRATPVSRLARPPAPPGQPRAAPRSATGGLVIVNGDQRTTTTNSPGAGI